MSDEALIVIDYRNREVAHTSRWEQLKTDALALSSCFGRVTDAIEQAEAVEILKNIGAAIKLCEDARVAVKKPVLELGRKVDAVSAAAVKDLEMERMRINKLIGDYQTAEQARIRAEEAARKQELDELERKRQQELAKATNHDQRDRINEIMDRQAAAVAPPIVVEKPKGLTVKPNEIEIKQIDSFVLMKARPDLVRKVEFDTVALKAAIKALKPGERMPGVQWEEVVKTSVRAGTMEAINV